MSGNLKEDKKARTIEERVSRLEKLVLLAIFTNLPELAEFLINLLA